MGEMEKEFRNGQVEKNRNGQVEKKFRNGAGE